MDPVNPWLDPTQVRHLAEQLLRPVAPARLSAADPGFDQTFVGFTPSDPAVEERELQPPQLPAQRETEAPAQALPQQESPPENPEPTHLPPSHTRFLERIQIFRNWLANNFGTTDIFILDHEGKVIFDESGHGRLHFMARNLALASRGSSHIHIKIGPASILEVIPCETPYGRIVLGAIVPEALPSAQVHTITEVLIQTASPA